MKRSGTVSLLECSTPRNMGLVRVACAALFALLTLVMPIQVRAGDLAPRLSFNRDIRPILAENCFKCHGPDAKQRKGKLRLDDEARRKVRRDPEALQSCQARSRRANSTYAITAEDADERMPPTDSGKSLRGDEIAKLKQWIAEGAAFEGHWAFIPPKRPHLPPVKNGAWCRNPIDYFILSKLESLGLAPSPEADKATLLKRLSLDLIGLPPELREEGAFLSDRSGDELKKQVERLLASPHYGERWGRIWLDAARYADSDGYEKDKPRQVWFYRDWVISAFNRDLPYDRVHHRADRRRPAAGRDAGPDRRHRASCATR